MKHLTQDDLVLHYYGETGRSAAHHLAECSQCRAEFQELSRVLAAIRAPEAPPRSTEYGAQVWHNLRPHLPEKAAASSWWLMPRRWAAMATVAALIVAAFLAGRYAERVRPQNPTVAAKTASPEGVLLVALGDHLDRSEMLLVEIAHAESPKDLDVTVERRHADDLLAANRLYRQTAMRVGDTATVAVLDDLERVLLQLAHAPDDPAALEQLQRQIEAKGLLFKVRVVQLNVKDEVKDRLPGVNPSQSRPTI
ncbi:MAG TPA: hypothetical protein VFU76_07490 [Terriglobales bacterium]|nr:hypothetical protein [Terriglobales bacterium]